MSALIDLYKTRYSEQNVLNSSNIDDQNATVANDDRINAVIDDVVSDFDKYAWVFLDPDDVDGRHASTACLGIWLRMSALASANIELDAWPRYYRELEAIKTSTPRNRMHNRHTRFPRFNGDVVDRIRKGTDSIDDLPLSFYNRGTCSVSGTSVTGVDTLWTSSLVSKDDSIGFGDSDPTRISTWYVIDSITDDLHLALTISAGTLTAGKYCIINRKAVR